VLFGDTVTEPLVRFEVLKPEPVQLVAFDDDHERVDEPPDAILVGFAERDTVGVGATTVYVTGQIRSTR